MTTNLPNAMLSGVKSIPTQSKTGPALYDDTFVNQDNTRAHLKEIFLSIDSRDRDTDLYPEANQYQVKLENYKNLKTIEFVNSAYPNQTGVLNEMYLSLSIPELEPVYQNSLESSNKGMFARLIPMFTTGPYIYAFNDNMHNQRIIYYVAGKNIDRLTLEFRKYDGTLFDFGTYTTPLDVDKQTMVTLKLTYIEPFIH